MEPADVLKKKRTRRRRPKKPGNPPKRPKPPTKPQFRWTSGHDAFVSKPQKRERAPRKEKEIIQEEKEESGSDAKESEEEKVDMQEIRRLARARRRKAKRKPEEMSTAAPVSTLRQAVPVEKRKWRDPRFDDLSGTFNPKAHDKYYGFLLEQREQEIQNTMKQMKKEKDPERKSQMMQALKQELTRAKTAQSRRTKLSQWKKEERMRVAEGKKPFYPKQKDIRKRLLQDEFRELEAKGGSGAVARKLAKRRKRVAAKDRRFMPRRRT